MSDSLSRLVEAVRSAGVDIAPGYCEYVRLAFAIANDCGEAGREGFIALCSLSVKFNREKAERLFSNALKKGDHRIHLGTAFHLAELAGVRLEPPSRPRDTHANNASNASNAAPFSHTRARDNNVEIEIEEQVDPFTHLPFFPEGHEWPRMLRQIMAFGQSREQRDVLLLGGLTTLGASLAQTLRFLYGGKWFFSSLQTFIVAPPASGKGVLAWTRMLVQPIHDEIRATVAEEMKRYKKEMTSFNSLGREKAKAEEPEMPLNRMFIFSGNNTGTGILQNIIDSGGVGIICETEADMVSNSIASDYGHWSEVIRSSFDHDPLSYNRRTDREYRELSALPPVGIDKRNARAGEAADPFQRERIVLPANVLLYAPCTSLDQPVQSTADRHVAGVPEIGQGLDRSLERDPETGGDLASLDRRANRLLQRGVPNLVRALPEGHRQRDEQLRRTDGHQYRTYPVDRRPIANNRGMRGGGRLRRQPAQVAPAHTRPADLRRQHQGRDHHPLGSLHPRG